MIAPAAPLAITEPPDQPGAAGPTFTAGLGLNTITGAVNGSIFSFNNGGAPPEIV